MGNKIVACFWVPVVVFLQDKASEQGTIKAPSRHHPIQQTNWLSFTLPLCP